MAFTILLAIVGIVCGIQLARKTRISDNLKRKFSHDVWKVGMIMLMLNVAILVATVLPTYLILSLHKGSAIIYMVTLFTLSIVAPLFSTYVWLLGKYLIGGPFRSRLFASLLGQSIYAILFLYFFYQNATLQPSVPGQDVFMQAIGYFLDMLVCVAAFLTGIIALCTPLANVIGRGQNG